MSDTPSRCPKCGSEKIVEVTRESDKARTWFCTRCNANIQEAVEITKNVLKESMGVGE